MNLFGATAEDRKRTMSLVLCTLMVWPLMVIASLGAAYYNRFGCPGRSV